MIKKISLVIMLVVSLFFVSSCGNSSDKKLLSCSDSVAEIEKTEKFSADLQLLTEKLANKYLNVDNSLYTDIAMKLDTSKVTCDQIIFINAKDQASLSKLKELITAYRDGTIADYRDYIPEEVPKLNAAVFKSNGLQLAFIVGNDSPSIEKALSSMWK